MPETTPTTPAPASLPATASALAPQTAEAPKSNPIKDLILARANQFKQGQELAAREAALKAKAPVTPAKAPEPEKAAEVAPEVKAATETVPDVKEPQTEDEWQKLWDTEQVPQIIAKVEADPKFKALKAFGLAAQVPVQMVKRLKDSEGKEHLTDIQMAEHMEQGIRKDLRAVMSEPNLKDVLAEIWAEITSTTPASTKTADAPKASEAETPEVIPDSLAAYVEKKKAKLAAKVPPAPPTLSNRPTDTPAAKIEDNATAPLPGETFAKWRKRTGAYG